MIDTYEKSFFMPFVTKIKPTKLIFNISNIYFSNFTNNIYFNNCFKTILIL